MRRYSTKKLFGIGVMLSAFFFMPEITSAETRSLSFEEAVQLALENNRLIEQREEDREAARWNLSAVRRSSGPRWSWSSTANRIGGRRVERLKRMILCVEKYYDSVY